MNSTGFMGTTIFKLFKKESDENKNEIEETIQEDQTDLENSINILCIVHKNGKIGSAFYNFQEKLVSFLFLAAQNICANISLQLYVYEEMVDSGPYFLNTTGLFREVKPKYILSFGNTADDFIKVLIDIVTTGGEFTVTSDSIRSLPENFFLLPSKEYSK